MKIKPSLPSGTRDFLPKEVAKRNYIFEIIKSVFEKYGFQQIETPVLENLATLTGKYGEEGDQLLFKVLNSGNPFDKLLSKDIDTIKSIYYLNNPPYSKPLPLPEIIHTTTSEKLEPLFDHVSVTKRLANRGLRYDLTVPLARYVVQHQNDLVFPFKRYHIAPVWRADRPQKGRYREFYQCDADVIGSNSLLNEVELTEIFSNVFDSLKLETEIRINNRKILEALSIYAKCVDKLESMTVAIDKIDKIGLSGIHSELINRGFENSQIELITEVLAVKNIAELNNTFAQIPVGLQGIEEINFVFKNCSAKNLVFDITLARGLNYYTGIIWEIKSTNTTMGSLGSGGRYANLTEMFGGRDMPGVGISFGIERIYDIMEELNLFPIHISQTTQVLFVHFSEINRDFAFPWVQQLRAQNIAAEIYPDKAKMEKQMKYANAKGIPFVAIIGDEEMNAGLISLKNMTSGEQEKITLAELQKKLGTA